MPTQWGWAMRLSLKDGADPAVRDARRQVVWWHYRWVTANQRRDKYGAFVAKIERNKWLKVLGV
jgi:hypothetical protein